MSAKFNINLSLRSDTRWLVSSSTPYSLDVLFPNGFDVGKDPASFSTGLA